MEKFRSPMILRGKTKKNKNLQSIDAYIGNNIIMEINKKDNTEVERSRNSSAGQSRMLPEIIKA